MTQTTDGPAPEVSVLGLGAIGTAVARTLLASGVAVTVWNRTSAKAAVLAEAGAVVAGTAEEAVAASPLVISCLWDYAATDAVLAAGRVETMLSGKTFVQLATGSAVEATEQGGRVHELGASFLAGGVMSFPRGIGAKGTIILYSGDLAAFDRYASLLAHIAPAQQHVGARPGDCAPMYLALWTFYFSALGGFIDGLALLAAHDLGHESVRPLVAPMTAKLVEGVADLMERLKARDFTGDQTTVASMRDGLMDALEQVRHQGLDSIMLTAFVDRLSIASTNGRGHEDVAAVADLLVQRAISDAPEGA